MGDGLRDRAFSRQLREVRANLVAMAEHVQRMIGQSVAALISGNLALALETISLDRKVNQLELETDELCLLVLALRQPPASDLRFVAFSLKMVTDLERIGDLAVNICERVRDLAPEPCRECPPELERMAELTCTMVRNAIDAFVRSDDALAASVLACDGDVDELYQVAFESLLADMTRDPAQVRRGVHLQSVAKWLERIGDHAANLAETAIFVIKGKDVRHKIHASTRPRPGSR
jgi:phosphate transport system protein